jgi:hypothetical protein
MNYRPSIDDVRVMLESRVTASQLEAEVKDIHRAIDRT